MKRAPMVVGVGMTSFGQYQDKTLPQLAGEAIGNALNDAGLPLSEIDAVFSSNSAAGLLTGQESIRGQVMLKPLGLGGVPIFNVENACASGSTAIHLAVSYIKAGAARCVLVLGCEKMVTEDRTAPMRAVEACCDLAEIGPIKAEMQASGQRGSIFMEFYARKVQRYFEANGGSPEHLARIAAKNHTNGVLNPHAQNRQARTPEQVLNSRSIVEPLTLLMCAPVSDGASAVVIADPEWAASHGKAGPIISATCLGSDSFSKEGSQMRSLCERAYREAGIDAGDIHVAEVHDATAAGELFEYENLGLAQPGRGWRLIEEGDVFLGGRVPVNPSGGLLSRGHPLGATGVAQIAELTQQLRGTAGERQVKGARVAVAQCAGGQSAFGLTTGAAAMSVVVMCS